MLAICATAVGYREFYKASYPVKYMDTIEQASGHTGVDPAVILAIIRTESGFRPDVVSSVGAQGLMQITTDTFDWVRYRAGETAELSPQVLYIPEQNIEYGSQTIALLLSEFENLPTALAAYHAGWGNVTSWLADERYSDDQKTLSYIPFSDTRGYVEKVLETAEIYQNIYPFLSEIEY